ncbi:secretion protein, HlyD family [Gottschalkia acidurici 9a]|uniref:Secretion protein, HlyD family n=1 Tax=Gottschalkia acidurici (strain ATCC 7906 / DSM 604 / BCRC 14475 / CIP 104303 / KCTC 5404 / NCIMB 10678 / 9a) TaxID=1128398 RepID=K0B2N9_GOTA9|nr:efflux RND transporter periplasmic adaptor subunit [Gottschalkia acidurici]AFS78866.1 secretion protein, HlyD family [Gottschalkia acidurici 9a]
MKKNKLLSFVIISILLLNLLVGCTSKNKKEKVSSKPKVIETQGIIEAKEVSINSKLPGRIIKLAVEEGAEVKAGDVLVEISSDELKAKEEQAKAVIEAARSQVEAAKGQVQAANATLQKAENGARDQEIAQAQAQYDLMAKTYERVDALYEKGAVSAQKKDEVAAQLELSKQQLSMAQEGARSEDKSGAQALVVQAMAMEEAAKGKLEQAQAALQEVQAYLKDSKIVSPINGVVTMLNSQEGELVSTGMSIATVSDLSNTWVEVKVKETDLSKIKLNQELDVKIPTYSKEKFKGKVVRINQKPDFATKRSTNENGEFDILSYGVKIELENKDKVLRPGMTAFVQFK